MPDCDPGGTGSTPVAHPIMPVMFPGRGRCPVKAEWAGSIPVTGAAVSMLPQGRTQNMPVVVLLLTGNAAPSRLACPCSLRGEGVPLKTGRSRFDSELGHLCNGPHHSR